MMSAYGLVSMALMASGCGTSMPSDSGVDAMSSDSASGAKPTCELIAERCHAFDGVEMTATMCHRAAEAPSATEASCQALRAQCLAACPENDGGHGHNEDAATGG
jgi:hypothetical protein